MAALSCARPVGAGHGHGRRPSKLRAARAQLTMRAWPVARSIFDAPLGACERSERADNKLDKRTASYTATGLGINLWHYNYIT